MDDENDPKIVSLLLRRKKQIGGGAQRDVVLALADELTKLMGEQQRRAVVAPDKTKAFDFACEQLLSVELATNALLTILERSLGAVVFNSVLVEVERRRGHYAVEWPAHEKSKTFIDHLDKEPAEPSEKGADVIPLRKKSDD